MTISPLALATIGHLKKSPKALATDGHLINDDEEIESPPPLIYFRSKPIWTVMDICMWSVGSGQTR
jgi:hypothetical protein